VTSARLRASSLVFGGLLCFAVGCASTGESAKQDKLTTNVGRYDPPPAQHSSAERPRVGVPPFKVEKNQTKVHNLDQLAADQMTTLVDQTERFNVIERAQIEQLLDEQNLEGIVKPEEMAKAGGVRGTDYLLLGRVTNFRVKQDQTKSGLNLGGIGGQIGGGKFGAGQSGFDKKNMRITTECGIDLRLVDPTTGRIAASHFGEFKRTDSANALGVTVLGVGTTSDAEVTIEEDDAGKILRLACDEALKKMLPKIDRELQTRGKSPTRSSAAKAPAKSAAVADDAGDADATPAPKASATGDNAAGAAPTAAGAKFCGNCGEKVASTVKFCPKCGTKIE
jgi:curli biogenesis system outer membrane secretion channel CsgG